MRKGPSSRLDIMIGPEESQRRYWERSVEAWKARCARHVIPRRLSHHWHQLDSSCIYLASSFCRWYHDGSTSQSPPTSRSLFDYAKLKQAHILELESGTGLVALALSPLARRCTPMDMPALLPPSRSSGKTCSPSARPPPARSPSQLWTGPSPRCSGSMSTWSRRTFCSLWTGSITRRSCVRCLQR
ncbi:hypothetical protein BC826DRAFT_1189856 [Russula brevipes]|nr:hypothetical protein BC826DRAFT_1189856 [Russula brevipes]